jgi:16S rRNA (uracil1498-N3)-methyltransferase
MAVHDFKSQRLYVENSLEQGKAFDALREQANYLLNVLRMKDGDSILVFNGKDGEWRAKVEEKGRKKCNLVPVEQIRPQPIPPRLVYCFAPLKQARLDYMVQKAVEMGVGVLQPVITQFTQAREVKAKRLHSNAVEAAEQCGILTLPEIREPLSIREMVTQLDDKTYLVFCDEAQTNQNAISLLEAKRNETMALLIGPEGGFSDEERELLAQRSNVIKLGLGPRILRADTAAVAALAILQAHAGDWYGGE